MAGRDLGPYRRLGGLAQLILPHGLYYGPVGVDTATAAIGAYQRGTITPERYRGRAGQPKPTQEAEYARLARAGSLEVAALA